jgi:hypothetical protein
MALIPKFPHCAQSYKNTMDQLPYLNTELAAGSFNGMGATFEVAGDLVIPDNRVLENVTIIQLDPTVTRKTITKTGGSNATLRNVKIDRGSDKVAGHIATSAGAFFNDVRGLTLDGVEVTGHGKGVGIYLLGVNNPVMRNLYVHDMRWSAASNPGTEQSFGIWMNNCAGFELFNPVVDRVESEIAGVVRPFQTDGICISGCTNFKITDPMVSFCGEGIDLTGSLGNRKFEINGGILSDIDAFALKLANSASRGTIHGMEFIRAGWSGFIASGPGEAGIPRCEDIDVIQCKAIDTGSNGRWAAQNVAGYSVMQAHIDLTYPQGVRLISCSAEDTQVVKTMKYAARNDNGTLNKLINFTASGWTVSKLLGTWG